MSFLSVIPYAKSTSGGFKWDIVEKKLLNRRDMVETAVVSAYAFSVQGT